MSIADYAALLVDAGEYSGRNDIAHRMTSRPKRASVSRTSRLPLAPGNEAPSSGRGFWDERFPGRSSLREAQGRWLE